MTIASTITVFTSSGAITTTNTTHTATITRIDNMLGNYCFAAHMTIVAVVGCSDFLSYCYLWY